MKRLAMTLACLMGALLAAPTAALITADGFAIGDGMVFDKRVEDDHVILGLFGTAGGDVLEVLCPLAEPGDLLAETCEMCEVGDVASMWEGLAPDPESSFPTTYRLTAVTIGHHGSAFAVRDGEVVGKRIEGSHVILDLWLDSGSGVLEVLCPMTQPGDLLAAACGMVDVGDVAHLWDGGPPDTASDYPTLHRLTSVTIGAPLYSVVFGDGFESGGLLAWSSSHS